MDNKINLSQLAELLSQAGGMSKAASEQFVRSFFDIISQRVLDEGIVKVKGLGTFKLLQMEDRESVNVNTGERFTIGGHQKISFVPDADLKDRINKPFSAFETVEITAEQAAEISDMEAPARQKPEPVQPKVKDITQKRSTRFWLRLLIWVLSIILVLIPTVILMWPVIGCKLLSIFDREITGNEEVITVPQTDSVNAAPAREIEPAEVIQPAKEPVKPAKEEAKPATKPATKPAAEPAKTQPAKPVTQSFSLNKEDQAKDLSLFTEADTVNYRIVGRLAVHTMLKGETLTKLALQYYGSKKLWPYIAKYNSYSNFNKMQPGSVIYIPKLGNK